MQNGAVSTTGLPVPADGSGHEPAVERWSSYCVKCRGNSVGEDRFDPALTYCNPRSGGCGDRRPRSSWADQMLEIIRKRKIELLVHVTAHTNVASILRLGLIPRDQHEKRGVVANCFDRYRRDGTGQTNLSITYANKWMLGDFVHRAPADWALLVLSPRLLAQAEGSIRFHQTNAATTEHRSGNDPRDLDAMFDKEIYCRTQQVARTIHRDARPDAVPTDDQAEITVGSDISPSMIDEVWFGTAAARQKFVSTNAHADRPRLLFHDPRDWWRPQP